MTEIVIVTAAFEAANGQWVATSRDVAGLYMTADTWTHLIERLPAVVRQRLGAASRRRREVAVEVLLHASLNVTVDAPAKYHIGQSVGPAL